MSLKEILTDKRMTRREFLRLAIPIGAGTVVAAEAVRNLAWPKHLVEAAEESGLPFENGKYQTFPRLIVKNHYLMGGRRRKIQRENVILQNIDIGTLGPDVDTIVGVDFVGNIPTNALEIYRPDEDSMIKETRVIFIKRAPLEDGSGSGLETVQLRKALGGDRFDLYQISEYGGNKALDAMARLHAQNTARKHQKVIYLGDLGSFQQQWGAGERALLNRMIRAQRPGRPDLGIPEPDFVNPRQF